MTNEQIYILSMLGIIFGSVGFGYLIGHQSGWWKGFAHGVERGGEIWSEVLEGDDDDDILGAKEIR